MKECLLYSDFLKNPANSGDVNCGSKEITSEPLVVNCANCTNSDIWCINHNKTGRLDYYFLYLISNNFEIETPDGKGILYEGELVVIPPRKSYKMTPEKGKPIYYLCIHITGCDVEKMLRRYGIEMFPKTNKLSVNNHLQERFKKLFDAYARNDEYRDRELAILAERIMIDAGRAIKSKKVERATLTRSIRFINESYSERIKITDLAKMENMCMTAYNKEFKAQMGISPTKYIINLRMQKATELLETTNYSIKEISVLCGYEDYNFFTRVFKSCMGISPTLYRKKK